MTPHTVYTILVVYILLKMRAELSPQAAALAGDVHHTGGLRAHLLGGAAMERCWSMSWQYRCMSWTAVVRSGRSVLLSKVEAKVANSWGRNLGT